MSMKRFRKPDCSYKNSNIFKTWILILTKTNQLASGRQTVRPGEDILDDVIFFTVTLIIVQLGYFNTNRKT